MRRIVLMLIAVVALAGVVAYTAPISGQPAGKAAPIYGIKIPAGYRDWTLISWRTKKATSTICVPSWATT
jgi:hypothetical protein